MHTFDLSLENIWVWFDMHGYLGYVWAWLKFWIGIGLVREYASVWF